MIYFSAQEIDTWSTTSDEGGHSGKQVRVCQNNTNLSVEYSRLGSFAMLEFWACNVPVRTYQASALWACDVASGKHQASGTRREPKDWFLVSGLFFCWRKRAGIHSEFPKYIQKPTVLTGQ